MKIVKTLKNFISTESINEGQFSWMTQDTDRQIGSEKQNTIKVYMYDNEGNQWFEKKYDGYGEFGGMDYYTLLAKMNGYSEEDLSKKGMEMRDLGIDISFKKLKTKIKGGKVLFPALVEDPKFNWKRHDFTQEAESDEYQSWYQEPDYDEEDDDYENGWYESTFVDFKGFLAVNEARQAPAKTLFKMVVKGSTSEIEGVKISKDMAQAALDWFDGSVYARKYEKQVKTAGMGAVAPLIFGDNWGIKKRIPSKLKAEFKELQTQYKRVIPENESVVKMDKEFAVVFAAVHEASRRKVHKAAKQGSYPAVIVVVQDDKVIHQEPVSTPDVAPATFNVMQEKYPKAILHLEDNTGKRLFTESVINEAKRFYLIGDEEVSRDEVLTYKYDNKDKPVAKNGWPKWMYTNTNYMTNKPLEWKSIKKDMKGLEKRYGKGNVVVGGATNGGGPYIEIYSKSQSTKYNESIVTEAKDSVLIKQLTDTFGKFKLTGKHEIMMDSVYGGGSKVAVLRKKKEYREGCIVDTLYIDGGSNYEGYIELKDARSARPIPGKNRFAADEIDDAMEAAVKHVDGIKESVTENRELMKIDSYLNTKDENVLIDFLDDAYGNSDDRKTKKEWNDVRNDLSYNELVDYAVSHAENFGMDLQDIEDAIEVYESIVTEAKDMTFADYLEVLDVKFEDAMAAVKGENGSDAEIKPTRGDILQNFTLFRNYVSSLTKKYKGDKTRLRFLTECVNEYTGIINESLVTEKLARGLKPLLTLGLNITKKVGEDALLDLSDKFDALGDEDSDSIASHLNMAIELMQDGYAGDATKKLKQFNKACKDVLNGKEVGSAFESVVTEGKFDNIDVKDLHFETDEKRAEDMKIELGKRQGEVTKTKQIEGGEYSLRRFRKEIKFGDGTYLGVFLPGSYDAATSKLGDGPHKKAVKKIKWNQKKYDQWLEDVASNDGWKNAFDMAQNAKNEPGLIDWVKKNNRGEDAMQRIQWDIEAFAESVVTEAKVSLDDLMDFTSKHLKFVKTSKEFDGTDGGLWTSGEDGATFKGRRIYDYYSENHKSYTFGVLNVWEKELNKRGYYSEYYDAGTVMIWEE